MKSLKELIKSPPPQVARDRRDEAGGIEAALIGEPRLSSAQLAGVAGQGALARAHLQRAEDIAREREAAGAKAKRVADAEWAEYQRRRSTGAFIP